MTTAALVLAILSLVMSAFALGWQILLYLLTSHRVKVKGIWTYAPGPLGVRRLFGVRAVNVGRQAVTIQHFGLHIPDEGGQLVEPTGVEWDPRLPYRLEPGDEATWHLPAAGVYRTCSERRIDVKSLRPFVRLPGSKEVRGKPYRHAAESN